MSHRNCTGSVLKLINYFRCNEHSIRKYSMLFHTELRRRRKDGFEMVKIMAVRKREKEP